MKKQRRKFWTPLRGTVIALLIIAAVAAAIAWYLQGKNVAVFNPQGTIASDEFNLIKFTLMLSAMVVIPVYIMLFAIAFRYRESNHEKKKVKYTPDAPDMRWLEVIWWAIPIMIIGLLAVVTWVSTHQLDPYRAIDSNVKPLRVQVVVLQWKWLFIYPDYHVASVNQLKLPAETPVNFAITADGPMSTFWIPNLGSQIYAMPGMTSQLSLMADHAGSYPGYNTNINGTGYSDMYFKAEALPTQQDFDQWAQSVTAKPDHKVLDWASYTELARPSRTRDVTYYGLKDDNLYTEVVNKFMEAKTPAVSTNEEGNK